jgi:hypothetical protein
MEMTTRGDLDDDDRPGAPHYNQDVHNDNNNSDDEELEEVEIVEDMNNRNHDGEVPRQVVFNTMAYYFIY